MESFSDWYDEQELVNGNEFVGNKSNETNNRTNGSFQLQKQDTKRIKEFIEKNPNSYIVVSCRSKGLLRCDAKRNSRYEVAFIPSLRDVLG